jgi:hypothetical protein
MAHLEGQKIGPYHLGKQLGWGGFGGVYEGRRWLSSQRWAVKVLYQQPLQDPDAQKRFYREAETQSSLNHPHIVSVNDYGIHRNWAYLAMPLIEGGTLSTVLQVAQQKNQPLSLDQILYYLRQISPALDYAQSKGIVHLDIKPQNFLVQHDGFVLLADFGLAHFLVGERLKTGSIEPAGSPAYMAPERWTSDAVKLSDIYALGITLYQLLVGQVPFPYDGKNYPQVMHQHLQETPKPPSFIRRGLPPALDGVMAKALAKDPNQRYQTAYELEAAFRAACPNAQEVAIPHRAYGVGSVPARVAPSRLAAFWGALRKGAQRLTFPRLHVLQGLRTIDWRTFKLKERTWFPRVVWKLPPLVFLLDLLLLPVIAGLLFHSWWVFAGAFLAPLLALAVCALGGDSKRRFLAIVGALLMGALWGLAGWGVGLLAQTPPLSAAAAVLASIVGMRLHVEAFPAQMRYVDSRTELQYWRWWLLCAVNALGLPLALAFSLHNTELFGKTALAALGVCLLFGMIGDKQQRRLLWGTATLFFTAFWGVVGWVLGLHVSASQVNLGTAHLPIISGVLALAGAVLGFLAHRYFFFARPVHWPTTAQARLGVVLAADLSSMPVVLGVWFHSWQVVGLALGVELFLFWLMQKTYQRKRASAPLRKYLPLVFGIFLASVAWATAAWGVGLLFPLARFSLHVSGVQVQGTWLSVALAVVAFFLSSPRHLKLFPITPLPPRSRRDKKTIRLWLLCACDLVALPLLLWLVLGQQWVPGVSCGVAFVLLTLAVIADFWGEPGLKIPVAVLAGMPWAITGWVLGNLLPDTPGISVHAWGWLIQGSFVALGAGGLGLAIGIALHQTSYTK